MHFYHFIFTPFVAGENAFLRNRKGILLHTKSPDTLTALSDTFHLKEQLKESDTLVESSNAHRHFRKKYTGTLDTTTRVKFNPKVAMLRSAIIPGWGQWYNKKYWKIPIIYGALGITAQACFFINLKTVSQTLTAISNLSCKKYPCK